MKISELTAVIVFALLVVVAVLGRLLRGTPRVQSGASAYTSTAGLLTPAERSFFGVLNQALCSQYHIFAKVRLADLVRPVPSPSRSGWQTAFNRIAAKHVDFVLCDSKDLSVACVIELDDKSHDRFERGFRDNLVDSALADAGIPVLRIAARRSYSPGQIQEQVQTLLNSRGKPQPQPSEQKMI